MKRIILFFCVSALFATLKAEGQETLMNEISYPFLDTLIALSKGYYARAKIYEVQIKSAEKNVNKAKLGWFEVLNFSYLYSPRNTTTIINPSLLNGPQFGVGLNIGTILQKPAQLKIAKNDLEIAWLQRDEYMAALEATVKERYFRYVQQLSNLKLLIQSEQDASGILQANKNKFEKGEETFENYSKVLADYTTRTQQKVASEADLLIAKARLEELIGVKLEAIH